MGVLGPDVPHTVTLSKAFYVGVFPVTQGQWSRVMGSNPSYFADNPKRPVEMVSWQDVRGDDKPDGPGKPGEKSFLGRLRAGTSLAMDLPTEAQWEYACRAGTTRALNDPSANKGEGADCTDENVAKIAWFAGNSGKETHDVGLKAPNAWGLYDMCGNVTQWCLDLLDEYHGDATDPIGPTPDKRRGGHILRGGYWSMPASGCRSSARSHQEANPPYDRRFNVVGVRAWCSRQVSSSTSGQPQGADRNGVQVLAKGNDFVAFVEHQAAEESLARFLGQHAKPAEIAGSDAAAGLNLDSHKSAGSDLQDDVDFVLAGDSAEVEQLRLGKAPGGLLAHSIATKFSTMPPADGAARSEAAELIPSRLAASPVSFRNALGDLTSRLPTLANHGGSGWTRNVACSSAR